MSENPRESLDDLRLVNRITLTLVTNPPMTGQEIALLLNADEDKVFEALGSFGFRVGRGIRNNLPAFVWHLPEGAIALSPESQPDA